MIVSDFGWIDNPILEIDPVNLPHRFTVWRDFRVGFKLDGKDTVLTVPAGTVTDLASIPRPLQGWLIEVVGAHMAAAVVHDYLCTIREPWPSDVAHQILYHAALASRTPEKTAQTLYDGVVLGGPKWD